MNMNTMLAFITFSILSTNWDVQNRSVPSRWLLQAVRSGQNVDPKYHQISVI